MKEYFSHDFNSRNDTKLVKVFMKYGLAGIGAYWCIVEMLYEESGYLLRTEYERISFELRTELELIKYLIEKSDLFVYDDEKFWSETALDRLNQRMDKSEKARKSVLKRWEKYKSSTNVEQSKNNSNTSKVKESKVKESKENIKGDKPYVFNFKKSLLDLGIEEDNAIEYLKHRKKARASDTGKAFEAIKNEREKTKYSANECIEIALGHKLRTGKVWVGIKAEWINNLDNGQYQKDLFGKQEPTISKSDDAKIGLAKRVAKRHYEETGEHIPYQHFLTGGS